MKNWQKYLKKIRRKIAEYTATNRLFMSYVILCVTQTVLIRYLTMGDISDFRPFILDTALILIIGSIGYLIKPKKQFAYFFTWVIIISLLSTINSIYYTFYLSFTSFGLILAMAFVSDVSDSLVEKLHWLDFIYLLAPIFFFYSHRLLYKTNYYNYVSKIERGKKMFVGTSLIGVIMIAIVMVGMTATDYSRLHKQWDREFIVRRFGIIMYQGNDLIQTLTLRLNTLFGYDVAARLHREFFAELALRQTEPNKYTNILKDKNIIFVHMESMQNFLIELEFGGKEVTPVMNQLAKEGMYFSRFYPQISTGTSSDTEFTLLTSLMPALQGIVFTNYHDRDFITIPKILRDQGYFTFSMHGNNGEMWNRNTAHASLGYDKFFHRDYFDCNPSNQVGLGISDKAFFEQSIAILEDVEQTHDRYMGTIITLSHHSPFSHLDKYGEFDLSYPTMRFNERTGEYEEVVDPFLEGTRMGNYLKSARYADEAMGEWIEYIKASDHFKNTVFIFYGDHEARLNRREFDFLYNYDLTTGAMRDENDPLYIDWDAFQHDLNKNTPLIIWTKDDRLQRQLRSNVDYVMGMLDIMPTIGNMMGFHNPYALGHDIFDIKENNIVIFPNGNFLTKDIYFSNSQDRYILINPNAVIDVGLIERLQQYTNDRLQISHGIIVYDLIKREREKGEE